MSKMTGGFKDIPYFTSTAKSIILVLMKDGTYRDEKRFECIRK